MKACDITKFIAELKGDSVQYRNKIYYSVACFRQLSYAIYSTVRPYTFTVKLTPYRNYCT